MTDYELRKRRGGDAYRTLIHPTLVEHGLVPYGDLIHAEGSSQDERAGIDWIVSRPNGTQIGIAVRVQRDIDYGTLTIRWRTGAGHLSELTKRYESIVNGGLYPSLTVQAYVTEDALLQAYVVSTRSLYEHVVIPVDDTRFRRCGCAGPIRRAPGGALFMPVAITERGRVRAASRATLIGHGVAVGMTAGRDVGAGIWTPLTPG